MTRGPQLEDLAHLGVHREVGVALAGAQLRDRAGRRRSPFPSSSAASCPAAAAGATWPAASAAPPATVTSPVRVRNSGPSTPMWSSRSSSFDQLVGLAQRILPEVELDPARSRPRGGRTSSCPAAAAPTSRPGDGDRGPVVAHRVIVRGQRLARRCGCGRTGRRTARRPAPRAAAQLVAPRRLDERALVAGHAALPPNRLRYASMNSSRSPSITRCTSPTFSSVRWSFTMV